MKIKTRLALILAVIAALIGLALYLQMRSEERQTQRMLADLQEEVTERLDVLLGSQGRVDPTFELGYQSLHDFAQDYSHWAEMADFVATGDPAWAAANIDPDLATFKANAAWVLRPDGSLRYGVVRQLSPSLRTLPLPLPALQARLMRERRMHFFLEAPEGVVEVVAAPLEPVGAPPDSVPSGWFLVGRLWDTAQLKSIALLIDGELLLLAPGEPLPPAAAGIDQVRELRGWDGQLVRQLHVRYMPPLLQTRLSSDESETAVMASFGALVVLVAVFAIARWVIRPLRLLEHGLSGGSPEPLAPLLASDNEFGRLARLAAATFRHRARLESEVEARQQTEAALRTSIQLRVRLARDLHDSVIQAIYATGLGLESVRQSLRDNPGAADQRLTAAQENLNQTIRQVRAFIADLEPEDLVSRPFGDELRLLAQTLSTLHTAELSLELAAGAEELLLPAERTHALQIVREAVSNALRHGRASKITLSLRESDRRPELTIEDNGTGFDPATVVRGSGLANMAARAAEIDAELVVDSAPGRGTKLVVRFRPRA